MCGSPDWKRRERAAWFQSSIGPTLAWPPHYKNMGRLLYTANEKHRTSLCVNLAVKESSKYGRLKKRRGIDLHGMEVLKSY